MHGLSSANTKFIAPQVPAIVSDFIGVTVTKAEIIGARNSRVFPNVDIAFQRRGRKHLQFSPRNSCIFQQNIINTNSSVSRTISSEMCTRVQLR